MDKLFLISADDYYKHIDDKVRLYGFLKQLAHFAKTAAKKGEVEHLKSAAVLYGQKTEEMAAGWGIPGQYHVFGNRDDLAQLTGKEVWGEYTIDEIGRLVEHLDGKEYTMRAVAADESPGVGVECSGCFMIDACRGCEDEDDDMDDGDALECAIAYLLDTMDTALQSIGNIGSRVSRLEAASVGLEENPELSRDENILAMRAGGATMQQIANHYRLTRGRVCQIIGSMA